MDSSRTDSTPTQILAGTPAPLALAFDADAKKHFDTFETHFFQQGDQVGLPGTTDDNYFERDSRIKRWLPYRTLMGISIASTSVAVLACIALWQSHGPAPTPPPITREAPMTPAVVALALAVTPPVPAPAPAASAPAAPGPELAPPVAAAAAPVPTPAAAAPAAQEPAAAPVAAPTPVEQTASATAPAVVEAELPVAEKPEADSPAIAAVPTGPSESRERCRESVRGRKAKNIVAACTAAFEADATFAEAAVAVAKVEFDRGRYTQAFAWSKKALAADPASADAYVYAGGAEQSRGHAKAAKEAYLQYLRLAPSGRYAAEVRAIVKSL